MLDGKILTCNITSAWTELIRPNDGSYALMAEPCMKKWQAGRPSWLALAVGVAEINACSTKNKMVASAFPANRQPPRGQVKPEAEREREREREKMKEQSTLAVP